MVPLFDYNLNFNRVIPVLGAPTYNCPFCSDVIALTSKSNTSRSDCSTTEISVLSKHFAGESCWRKLQKLVATFLQKLLLVFLDFHHQLVAQDGQTQVTLAVTRETRRFFVSRGGTMFLLGMHRLRQIKPGTEGIHETKKNHRSLAWNILTTQIKLSRRRFFQHQIQKINVWTKALSDSAQKVMTLNV